MLARVPLGVIRPVPSPAAVPAARAGILAILLAGALAAGLPPAAPASAPESGSGEAVVSSFTAVADARVEEANPALAFGRATRLGTDGDAGTRIESYLRFSLSGVRHTVGTATLRLYVVSDGSADGPSVRPAGTAWREDELTWNTSPGAVGPVVARTGQIAAGTWIEVDVTPLVKGDGDLNLLLSQSGTDGAAFYSRQSLRPPTLVVTSSDPVVMAAGDIACAPGRAVTATACRHASTADLLAAEPWLTRILMLGDAQYEDGLLGEFMAPGAFHDTWGRLKPLIRPTPGNHEYHVPGAAGYFEYFGAAAHPESRGLYSFDLPGWHLISLNSEISTAAGAAQDRWLRADLAATDKACILAYWHRPRFSSGSHGGSAGIGPLWQALHEAGADVVLNGHDHDYERFAPQDPSGLPKADGIRAFVVGTGGAENVGFRPLPAPNSEVRDASTAGVLRLALHESGYDWAFVPEAPGRFTDSGSSSCHATPPAASLTASPDDGIAPQQVTLDASASAGHRRTPIVAYDFDFGDGSPATGAQATPVAVHTYGAPGTYDVTVRVTDSSGRTATAASRVVVRDNLVRNNGFETDLLGWNTSGSAPGVVLTQAAGGRSGERAAEVRNEGSVAGSCVLNDSPNWIRTTAGGTYTGSLWVRGDVSGARLRLRMREWAGTLLVGSASEEVVLTPFWQKVRVSHAPIAPGLTTLDFNAYVSGSPPGTCFYADDAAVTRG